MLKRLISAVIAAAFVAVAFAPMAGCNTIEGAGRDIEKGGKAIKDEANEQRK
jgi:predicted small secreted protein